MTVHHASLRLALILIGTIAVSGCVVGTAYVNAPARLPSQPLPVVARPISFDVCVVPDPQLKWAHFDGRRRALGDRVRIALRHAGVRAALTADAGSPVDFTISLRKESGPMGSFMLSLLTLSVVPGYEVERTTLDVNLAGRNAEHLQYQARTTLLIWLPLILSPDIFMTLSDGWQSPTINDGGFRQMVGRLGDDLRLRLGHDGSEPPAPQTPGVKCDNSLDHAPSEPRYRPAVAAGLR